MAKFYCRGVVKGMPVEEKLTAVTEKQAWYKFCKKYGFNMYDFRAIEIS